MDSALVDGVGCCGETVNPEGMDDELEVFVEMHIDLFEGNDPTTEPMISNRLCQKRTSSALLKYVTSN